MLFIALKLQYILLISRVVSRRGQKLSCQVSFTLFFIWIKCAQVIDLTLTIRVRGSLWFGLVGGVIIIIDDFLSVGVARDDPDVDLFARSWIANAVHTTTEIANWADQMGMTLARDRDLGSVSTTKRI